MDEERWAKKPSLQVQVHDNAPGQHSHVRICPIVLCSIGAGGTRGCNDGGECEPRVKERTMSPTLSMNVLPSLKSGKCEETRQIRHHFPCHPRIDKQQSEKEEGVTRGMDGGCDRWVVRILTSALFCI